MRIKKHENGNEYLLTEDGVWVRNFTKKVSPIDINRLNGREEYGTLVQNEVKNNRLDLAELDTSTISYQNAIIVSDGYDFARKHLLLKNLPSNIIIMTVNRSLAKWEAQRRVDFFVVNNPYEQCMMQMPEKNFPKCLASSKTYAPFLEGYSEAGGMIYKYSAVQERNFLPIHSRSICQIDEYRNPICAAIGLAYRLSVKKLLLFCCDDAFNGERPGAEKLKNGLWIYPQQRMGHRIIDAQMHWYAKDKVKIRVGDHSSGPEYKEVPYIPQEKIIEFFT